MDGHMLDQALISFHYLKTNTLFCNKFCTNLLCGFIVGQYPCVNRLAKIPPKIGFAKFCEGPVYNDDVGRSGFLQTIDYVVFPKQVNGERI